MQELARNLMPFIPGSPEIEIIKNEYSSEIVDKQTREVYGYVHFDEYKLIGFESEIDYEDEVQLPYDIPIRQKEILHKAQLFVDTFLEKEVHFSMFNEWSSNNFMVTFEERDPKLALLLPHTGCTLYFTRDAVLTTANVGRSEINLEYPSIKITEQEAKEKLKNANYLQLAIHFPDINDSHSEAELIYHPNHSIMGIGVDGAIDTVTDFLGTKKPATLQIPPVKPTKTKEELLGVPHSLQKKTGEENATIWVDSFLSNNEDMEEEALVSIFDNELRHFSFSNTPFEKSEGLKPISLKELTEIALQYLELVEGNINQKYVLEEPTPVEEHSEELQENDLDEEINSDIDEDESWEDYLEPEPTQMFTFYRQHDGFKIENLEANIDVGRYTGLIRGCSVTRLTRKQEKSLYDINTTPVISLKEAELRFFSEIEMVLTRVVKYFDQQDVYTLSYGINFPRTGGHIEKINAITGEVSYVETGILKENYLYE
ncbi:hypothetical protein [Ornithinibacillus xuwenensis]|uniref:DUF4901 domain-containing protein n=1 Tax=Ornithinibacillus xuwenensis TaxID=3144668 RepID=A0ABU9XGS0_9BACI